MKELNHDNVNRFFGVSTEPNDYIIFLWLDSGKRNLADVIFNDDIRLDLTFQTSILRDIITVQ